MRWLEQLTLRALHALPPEQAHDVALAALRTNLLPLPGPVTAPALATDLAGITLANPVGLAAGLDKNARALPALSRAGFGFLEVGAATPRPQPGNAKPRLFRLPRERAIINRFGFNNDGAERITERLAQGPRTIPVGLNLGANKDSPDRAQDYVEVLRQSAAHIAFATLNISSPNTAALRTLQEREALVELVARVSRERDRLRPALPLFIKIAPDLTEAQLEDIAEIALSAPIQGVIATNTTLSRAGLTSAGHSEAGGLSGPPLAERATAMLARLYLRTEGQLALIGVGGITDARDALTRIEAGATAIQVYTSLIYNGLSQAAAIAEGLQRLAEERGIANLSELRGTRASMLA